VSNEAMGYIFEELLRKFSEMSNETAGEHYTPREVIQLMVDLLLTGPASAELTENPIPVRTVYDPAAGTGGTARTHRGLSEICRQRPPMTSGTRCRRQSGPRAEVPT